jgi:hypothetical protein
MRVWPKKAMLGPAVLGVLFLRQAVPHTTKSDAMATLLKKEGETVNLSIIKKERRSVQ